MPEIRRSVCALDCPDTCAMLVQIGADGRATKLSGDPAHPITRGFLCGKVTQYLEREYHPERLLYPLRRIGVKGEGRFERVTWDEALDAIAGRLQNIAMRSGSEAILPYSYGGTMGLLNGAGMDRRFFHRLGASRLDRTICASAGGEALTRSQGLKAGMEPEQFVHSKLILAWGANILGTNSHLWPFIVEARRRGAKFYVIDPFRNRTGKAADRHFAINPGSDLALALGMMHVLIRDELTDREYLQRHSAGYPELAELARRYTPQETARLTGIDAADIEMLAREYGTAKPPAIRVNYGVQRSERGGAAIRAIAALPVLTGAWRLAGGGLQLTNSGAFELNTGSLERPDLQWVSPLGREARLVNMSRLGDALTKLENPPVEALVVYNSNPAAIAPMQGEVLAGLGRPDLFVVVLEQFQTDTADFADYVLPATTFLEHTDLYRAYGHYYLQLARPAVRAPGETLSNVQVFRALARRMGFGDSCFAESDDEMIASLLRSNSPFLEGITLERLERERSIRLNVSVEGTPFLPFAHGFRTKSGRFEFEAGTLAYVPPAESRHGSASNGFPLELISPKNDDSMNSTLGNRDTVDSQTAVLSIHYHDAEARGIKTGDPVKVFNARGACTLFARVTGDVKPGVVVSRSTRWNKRAPNCFGVNQLTSDILTDLGGGPTFYNCLVEVVPEPEHQRA